MSDHGESAQTGDESYPSLRNNWDFLRLLFGRLVTNAGDSLYAVAAMWLVHEVTGSTIYTGIAESLLLLPLVLQFISGPLVAEKTDEVWQQAKPFVCGAFALDRDQNWHIREKAF